MLYTAWGLVTPHTKQEQHQPRRLASKQRNTSNPIMFMLIMSLFIVILYIEKLRCMHACMLS